MDSLQVSEKILPFEVAKKTPKELKLTPFFRPVNTTEGKRFDLNVPSIGSFRLNIIELLLFILLFGRILKIY